MAYMTIQSVDYILVLVSIEHTLTNRCQANRRFGALAPIEAIQAFAHACRGEGDAASLKSS